MIQKEGKLKGIGFRAALRPKPETQRGEALGGGGDTGGGGISSISLVLEGKKDWGMEF